MFNSDTGAETYRWHIFNQFPEHRKIPIPLGKPESAENYSLCVGMWEGSPGLCCVLYRADQWIWEMFSVEQRALTCITVCEVCITETKLPRSCKKYYLSTVWLTEKYKKLWKIFERGSGPEGGKKTYCKWGEISDTGTWIKKPPENLCLCWLLKMGRQKPQLRQQHYF